MIQRETILARRNALIADLEQGKTQFEQLDRQLCALAGGIQALNELLDGDAPRDPQDIQESRLGEAHQTIDMMQAAGAWNDSIWKAKREHMDGETP